MTALRDGLTANFEASDSVNSFLTLTGIDNLGRPFYVLLEGKSVGFESLDDGPLNLLLRLVSNGINAFDHYCPACGRRSDEDDGGTTT